MNPDRFRHLITEVYGYSLEGFGRRMGIGRTGLYEMVNGEKPIPEPLRMLLEGEGLEPAAPEYRDKRVRG